jgi:hypothetical protein
MGIQFDVLVMKSACLGDEFAAQINVGELAQCRAALHDQPPRGIAQLFLHEGEAFYH